MKSKIKSILFCAGAIIMAVVLFISAVLICIVKLIRPERLTPLVAEYVNNMVDARVEIGNIDLKFEPAFPILRLKVEDLTIISHSLDLVPEDIRETLPAYSDSLLSVKRLQGKVNLHKLLVSNELSLSNFEIVSPAINIVIAPDGKSNFDIYRNQKGTEGSTDTSTLKDLPAFSIDHFLITEGREIRYYNAVDSTEASILMLVKAELDGTGVPMYKLELGGSLTTPMTKNLLELDGLSFGLDGNIRWKPANPLQIDISDFHLAASFMDAVVEAELDFTDDFIIKSASVDLKPVSITDIVRLFPSDIRKRYRLNEPFFKTDMTVGFAGSLTAPFNASVDTIPFSQFRVIIPQSDLKYGKSRFHKLSLSLEGTTSGNNLDEAFISISEFTIAGPATELRVKADLTHLISDPAFDGEVYGHINLANFPEILQERLKGYTSGQLKAEVSVTGTSSMFTKSSFHKLKVTGNIEGKELYWLTVDTANMIDINHLSVEFDSHRRIQHRDKLSREMLSAKVKSDTAAMLFGGVELNYDSLALNAAVENMDFGSDSLAVVPVGGSIGLKSLRVVSVTDKAGVRIKELKGRIMMRRFKGNTHVPEFILDVKAGRLAAGGGGTVGMLANTGIFARMHKIPGKVERRMKLQAKVDSIRRSYPDLSPDSVIALAIEKRTHRGGKKHSHVKLEEVNDYEAIDWGASRNFRRFINDWELEGSIGTRHARMFSPYFPIRNRIRELDITFNSDTVEIRSLKYKGGKTDLSLKGRVSNIRRSFGSSRTNSAVKVNLNISSDTIDVNELAVASFAGADFFHKEGKEKLGYSLDDNKLEDDNFIEEKIERKSAPLLIPYNIDANISLSAGNILYSDLLMKHLKGDILVYDGAVNLHDLSASSDAGSLSLSALYSAPNVKNMDFGFGMELQDFKIEKFLKLVPAIDSIMPLMRDFSGTIDADLAATVKIDSAMNFILPSLDAAVKLQGDSLALINPETYRTIGRWLRFKDKTDNTIKHMDVELVIRDNKMELFPFTLDIDRYKLGVVGYNDLALNFDYHISVLKSPLPFKFGINIKGNPEHYKVRLGGSKFKEGAVVRSVAVVDTARVNLVRQIQEVFRRGVRNSRFARLQFNSNAGSGMLSDAENTFSHADSLALIKEGFIDSPVPINTEAQAPNSADSKKQKKIKKENNEARKDD